LPSAASTVDGVSTVGSTAVGGTGVGSAAEHAAVITETVTLRIKSVIGFMKTP